MEDAWPLWINNYLPPRMVQQTFIGDNFQPVDQGFRKTVAGDRVGVVCETCNSGWMSDIETASASILGPMMQGCGTLLDERAQTLIGTWIVKTYLMHAARNPKRALFVDLPQLYEHLYRERAPHPLHQVSIGAFGGERWLTVFHLQPVRLVVENPNTGTVSVRGHLGTVCVGHFVGQAWLINDPKLRMTINGDPKPSVRYIWPYEDDFVWPPGPFITTTVLERLARTDLPKDPEETLPNSSEPWNIPRREPR